MSFELKAVVVAAYGLVGLILGVGASRHMRRDSFKGRIDLSSILVGGQYLPGGKGWLTAVRLWALGVLVVAGVLFLWSTD
ncbi:MAG TPA: hypothetical protein VFU23_06820 [Gemmatimonadales bacterium]|nr:hypothetical protein [Gemmatimonadales bacterium]